MTADASDRTPVPAERIADIDIYAIPGGDSDLHRAWQNLREQYPQRLLWTPHNGGHWLAMDGEDIARIYADHENFSSRITIVPKKWGELFPLRPTTLDPPEHRPYRKLMTAALSRARVQASEAAIKAIIIDTIERVRLQGRCEFINDVALLIPGRIFLHMARMPDELVEDIPRYAEPPNASDVPVMERFARFLRPWVVERQARPGDDLLSQLVSGQLNGKDISEDEALDVATAMLTGGIDTVISLLSFIIGFLAEHPHHQQWLIENPDRIPSAVPELIRRFPIMTKARELKSDQVLDGIQMRAGDMIVLPPLQGLDERIYTDPMAVNFKRQHSPDLSFGNGVHLCPGSYLASTELEIFLREWLARVPGFQPPEQTRPRMSSGILGAMLELHLRWDPQHSPEEQQSP